jgi:hypothetical protein
MGYKPRVNERKHRRLIADALTLAEQAGEELRPLRQAARNDATKAHIQRIEIRLLELRTLLYQMRDIAKGDIDDGTE